jgi:hypothetical protein
MQTPLKTLTPVMVLTLALTISGAAFAMPGYAPAATGAPAASSAQTLIKGIVVENIDSGGYTYLQIENSGQKRWVAINKTAIKLGQEVEIAPGVEMGQYTSPSLNRTFDSIYFSRGLVGNQGQLPHPVPETKKMSMPATAAPTPGHGMSAPGGKTAPLPPTATITGKVAETFDAGGYTYVAIEREGQRTWVASPPVKVVQGQEVSFKSGFVMRNFTSGSLGRSFDSIVFTAGLATLPPPSAPATPGK